MTGFATRTEGGVTVTLKTVNGKSLDLHFHLPAVYEPAEPALRQMLREHMARGTVQVRVAWNTERQSGLNRPMLHAWLATFREASEELGLHAEPDLNAALRLPGMFENAMAVADPPDLPPILQAALRDLNQFRQTEGAQLGRELNARARALLELAGEIEDLRATASEVFHERLNARLSELLENAIDPQRLAVEVAVLVEKSDVAEELLRLRTHTGQLIALLSCDGEIGKKIDFLLQEMNRETNTVLSKTGGLGSVGLRITELALAAKSEIDKIREQALNLE